MSWEGRPHLRPMVIGATQGRSLPRGPEAQAGHQGCPVEASLQGQTVVACLLVGFPVAVPDVARLGEAFPVAVPDVARLGEAAVVRTVARAVDCVAVLREGPVGRVVAQVTGGPVAVDLCVAVGTGADVARVVTAEVLQGDSAGTVPGVLFSPTHTPPGASSHTVGPLPGPYPPRRPLVVSGWLGLSLPVWMKKPWLGGWASAWAPWVLLGSRAQCWGSARCWPWPWLAWFLWQASLWGTCVLLLWSRQLPPHALEEEPSSLLGL